MVSFVHVPQSCQAVRVGWMTYGVSNYMTSKPEAPWQPRSTLEPRNPQPQVKLQAPKHGCSRLFRTLIASTTTTVTTTTTQMTTTTQDLHHDHHDAPGDARRAPRDIRKLPRDHQDKRPNCFPPCPAGFRDTPTMVSPNYFAIF